jgi:hypothetical protein
LGSGIVDQIQAARLCTKPWPHLEFDEFLPSADAARISEQWPTTGYMWLRHSDIAKADGTSLRRYQPLDLAFPDIAERLKSAETRNAFRARLSVDDAALHPVALLVEDLPGYWIRRHTDCAGKVISAQCYLAEDDQHETQGACFEEKQIPYRFNHGYAFKVTRGSWHRVRRSPARRRSIQLIYYSTPEPVL